MLIAMIAGLHWHTQMYLDAFRAAGKAIGAVYVRPAGQWPSGEPVKHVRSLGELVALRPDLVIVLDTPQGMLETTRWLIGQGIRVAVEKPVGNDPAALLALAAFARDRGAFVSVAQPHLLNDFWQHIPANPGRLSHFRFRLINGSPQRYREWGVPWVLDPQVAGGGVLRNLGIHGVSAFAQLTGERARVHAALLSSVLYGLDVEEYASLTLRAGSALGHIEVGYTLGSDLDSEFEMTSHWQHISVRDDGAHLHVLNRLTGERSQAACLPLPCRYEQFAHATLDALRGASALVHDLEAHAGAMSTIDEAYARAAWVRP